MFFYLLFYGFIFVQYKCWLQLKMIAKMSSNLIENINKYY